MDFSELCALVGALRDRVAELEAKEAARVEACEPIDFNISLAGVEGNSEVCRIVEAAVAKGLASVPEISRQHKARFD